MASRKKTPRSGGVKLFIGLLLLLGTAFVAGDWFLQEYYQHHLNTPALPDSSQRVQFEVTKGSNGKIIAEKLEAKGLIHSPWAFREYIKEQNLSSKLHAGNFVLQASQTIPEIVEELMKSKNQEIVVTIREGLTIKQVDSYLSEKGILSPGEFSNCAKTCQFNSPFLQDLPAGQSLEGYLFPDTYFVNAQKVTAESLIKRMLSNFEKKYNSLNLSTEQKNKYPLHQRVTMASLIEKESRKTSEKSIISGILWKRLEEGILLGVDATVRYVLDKWTAPLTVTDLNINSPYNTRKKAGLPPGPISNFGLESLKAAYTPQKSNYYYYLHGRDGQIRYGRNNAEHVQNKRQYL